MSSVFWVMLETDVEDCDYDDLGLLYRELDELDRMAKRTNVKPLSEFVDYSDMEFNISDEDLGEEWLEEHAQYFSAMELQTTLQALEAVLSQTEGNEELLDEIRYALNRCLEAEKVKTRVRVLAVM